VPGEAIDSWLEATAQRMEVSLGAIARALDLPSTTRPTWMRWLSPDQLETIEAATGVSVNAVEAMTLGVYDGTALQLDPDSHRGLAGMNGTRSRRGVSLSSVLRPRSGHGVP
jgi:hypothetical protein